MGSVKLEQRDVHVREDQKSVMVQRCCKKTLCAENFACAVCAIKLTAKQVHASLAMKTKTKAYHVNAQQFQATTTSCVIPNTALDS